MQLHPDAGVVQKAVNILNAIIATINSKVIYLFGMLSFPEVIAIGNRLFLKEITAKARQATNEAVNLLHIAPGSYYRPFTTC